MSECISSNRVLSRCISFAEDLQRAYGIWSRRVHLVLDQQTQPCHSLLQILALFWEGLEVGGRSKMHISFVLYRWNFISTLYCQRPSAASRFVF